MRERDRLLARQREGERKRERKGKTKKRIKTEITRPITRETRYRVGKTERKRQITSWIEEQRGREMIQPI